MTVNASGLNTTKINTLNVAQYSTNFTINKMQKQIHKTNNSRITSTSTEYVKLQNVSTDPNKSIYTSTAYTKEQYLKEITKTAPTKINTINPLVSVSTPPSQYGWITLTLEVDYSYLNDGTYDVYGFYNWLV